jgi:hypothetical protein
MSRAHSIPSYALDLNAQHNSKPSSSLRFPHIVYKLHCSHVAVHQSALLQIIFKFHSRPEQPENTHTILSISPQTTLCPSKPALPGPVRNPSLPATKSLHSLPTTCKTLPAFLTCSGLNPKEVHLPILVFRSDSQRGLSAAAPFSCTTSICSLVCSCTLAAAEKLLPTRAGADAKRQLNA